MVRENDLICQTALESILSIEFPSTYFSFGKYSEEAVCLEQNDDNWVVYVGIRNKKDKPITYGTVFEACLGMIRRLTATDNHKEKSIINSFLDKTALVVKEDDMYIAKDLATNVATQGASAEDAIDSLREALELYYEDNNHNERADMNN